MKQMVFASGLGLAVMGFGAVTASAAELRVTTFENPWQEQSASVGEACAASAATVKLALDKTDRSR